MDPTDDIYLNGDYIFVDAPGDCLRLLHFHRIHGVFCGRREKMVYLQLMSNPSGGLCWYRLDGEWVWAWWDEDDNRHAIAEDSNIFVLHSGTSWYAKISRDDREDLVNRVVDVMGEPLNDFVEMQSMENMEYFFLEFNGVELQDMMPDSPTSNNQPDSPHHWWQRLEFDTLWLANCQDINDNRAFVMTFGEGDRFGLAACREADGAWRWGRWEQRWFDNNGQARVRNLSVREIVYVVRKISERLQWFVKVSDNPADVIIHELNREIGADTFELYVLNNYDNMKHFFRRYAGRSLRIAYGFELDANESENEAEGEQNESEEESVNDFNLVDCIRSELHREEHASQIDRLIAGPSR